jgi:Multiubiquitin
MPKDHKITIHIDRNPYRVGEEQLTGAQLRSLTEPPIGTDRDLYEVVPGPGDDRLIGDDDVVSLHEGIHFFTAPHTIIPGRAASC